GVQVDHETDGRMLHKVAAANSEPSDLDEARQFRGWPDLNFVADCRQMDTVVANQNRPFDHPGAARHDQIEGTARLAGA
ncbi:hypothetical protein WAC32_28870, partial [Klebsiella pneumoniae]